MAIFGSKKQSTSAKAPAVAKAMADKPADKDKKDEGEAEVKTAAADIVFKVPQVLVQPRISEKAGHLVKLNKYVFNVKPSANKVEVKKAVESFYKVRVTMVNMVSMKGRTRNYGRTTGRTNGFKKAVVTLKKGDKIEGLTDVV